MQLSYKSTKASEVQIPKPVLGTDQILVKVHYAALDTGTDEVLQQSLSGMFIHAKAKKNGPPLVLGWHFTGSVEEFGVNVNKETVQPSDMVWGFLQYWPHQKQGSFSEYIAVHVNECALVPKNVPLEQVAAASTEALTALQAMRDLGNLSAGKSILVLGAGGGVGSAAVQIAKNLGAHVTASCSTKDVKRVKDLGADVVIDRGIQDPLATGSKSKYDVIFDAPNKYSAVRAMRILRPKGAYVVTMWTWSLLAAIFLSIFNGKKAKFIECFSKREDLDVVGKWLQEGKLRIDVDSTFPVRNLEQAMTRQNDKSKLGRVLVQVDHGWKD
jgi:NADPH:quinone reductase-like Zn-dependent oxidoreductase